MNCDLSIILLFYNKWDMTMKRLAELATFMPWEGCELVLVDNGSTEDWSAQSIEWWVANFSKPLVYVNSTKNIGFSGGMNLGVSKSKGNNLLLLSNDVRIKKPAYEEIYSCINGMDKVLFGDRVIDWPGGWNEFKINGKKYLLPYCEGYALGLTRKSWDILEGFDEMYNPHDYEDVDLSMKAKYNDFILGRFPQGIFEHSGGKTINHQTREAITQEHRKVFLKKWEKNIPNVLEEVR